MAANGDAREQAETWRTVQFFVAPELVGPVDDLSVVVRTVTFNLPILSCAMEKWCKQLIPVVL